MYSKVVFRLVSELAGRVREDVYAVFRGKGGYRPIPDPLNAKVLRDHLNSSPAIGVYLFNPGEDAVRFACYDIDDHDGSAGWAGAVKVAELLSAAAREHGLQTNAVRSGGGQGIHLIFMFEEPQKARIVRQTLTKVAEECDLSVGNGGIGASQVEIFPKQKKVSEGGYGNLIALPFARKSALLDPVTFEVLNEEALEYYNWDISRFLEMCTSEKPQEASTENNTGVRDVSEFDLATVMKALYQLNPDGYEGWYRPGMAMKNTFGEKGLEHWLGWSSLSEKYEREEAITKWETFDPKLPEEQLTAASILHWAKQAESGPGSGPGISIVEKDGQLGKWKGPLKNQHFEAITSFVIKPLSSINVPGRGEHLKVDLVSGQIRKTITIPPEAWHSQTRFLSVLPSKEFAFYGSNTDVQRIRQHLSGFDMSVRTGVHTAGFHDGCFVTSKGALDSEGKSTEDLSYVGDLDNKCCLISTEAASPEELSRMAEIIDKFNSPQIALPVLGWGVACYFKKSLAPFTGNRFPLLNPQGEAGSGKTSTVEGILMPLHGLRGPANSIGEQTRFTMMKHVSSSNTIPVYLEENKASRSSETQNRLVSSLIRQSYDGLEGNRGRADQSLVSYRYEAPICIVGESGFTETAVLDRLVTAFFSKATSAPHLEKFKELQSLPLEKLGRTILEKALTMTKAEVEEAFSVEMESVSYELKDRPRENAATARFGLEILGSILGRDFDKAAVDRAIKEGVYGTDGTCRKSAVDQILEAFFVMAESCSGNLGEEYFAQERLVKGIHYQVDGKELRIWSTGAYPIFLKWAKMHDFEGEKLPKATFLSQVKTEPYFVARKSAQIGQKIKSALILDIEGMVKKGLEVPGQGQESEEATPGIPFKAEKDVQHFDC